ncbi:MAG: patatin-like phospholipase family protein, partial [Pseudomonadales bacterium]
PAVADISLAEKREFFERAHQCFGHSALMMSGAGSLLYFHIGALKAMHTQNLLPTILSGSSGGAFVGAIAGTHADSELENVFSPDNLVYEVNRKRGLGGRISVLKPNLMKIEEIKAIYNRLIPDLTFQQAYELTGRRLNVSIAAAERHQTSRLLNAVTSPNVCIREAVQASGAVPGVYPPVTLMARNRSGERQIFLPSHKWVDGSVSDDLPAKRLARLYGVNHFIVSQTNPHVLPFITDAKRKRDAISIVKYASIRASREWLNAGVALAQKPLSRNRRLQQWINMGISIINQDYIGDINILPPLRLQNPYNLLAHATREDIASLVLSGERATWPHLEMIRIQTRIGKLLDDILGELSS